MVTEGEHARLWAQIMDRLNLTVSPKPESRDPNTVCLEVHCADNSTKFVTAKPNVPAWKPIRLRPEALRTIHLPVQDV